MPRQHFLLRWLHQEGEESQEVCTTTATRVPLASQAHWRQVELQDGDYFNDLFEFNIPKAHWTRACPRLQFGFDEGRVPPQSTVHLVCVGLAAVSAVFVRGLDAAQKPSVRTDHSCVVYEAGLRLCGRIESSLFLVRQVCTSSVASTVALASRQDRMLCLVTST